MRGLMVLLSLSILFSFPLKAQTESSGLRGKAYVHVSIGRHTQDEFIFEKGKRWKLSFIDRGLLSKEVVRKRWVPQDLALPLVSELERIMRLNQEELSFLPGYGCTTQMTVAWGASSASKTERAYCLDRLSSSSNHELADWMRSFKRLFRF